MTVKTTGALFKAFWNDESWCPKDSGKYVEEECVYLGESDEDEPLDPLSTDYGKDIPDDAVVTLVGGELIDDRPGFNTRTPLERILRAWIEKQTTTALVVHCPKDKVDLVRIALSTIPGVRVG